jgi:hypothetical protein
VPEVIDNNVEARGGPQGAGSSTVESLDEQHNVDIDVTLGPNVRILMFSFTTSMMIFPLLSARLKL